MAAKIDPAELEIDWARPAVEIDRLVRLGGAWTTFRGKRLKVWRAEIGADPTSGGGVPAEPGTLDGLEVATAEGALTLVEVQPEGKGRQSAQSWRNGSRPRRRRTARPMSAVPTKAPTPAPGSRRASWPSMPSSASTATAPTPT